MSIHDCQTLLSIKMQGTVRWSPLQSSTMPQPQRQPKQQQQQQQHQTAPPVSDQHQRPSGRWKQASVLHNGWLYVHGGRCGRQPLKDLWRWRESSGWRRVHLTGSMPPPLEGHTMVARRGHLYIFGGTYGGYPDCPLWIVSPRFGLSRQWEASSRDVVRIGSRRCHSAVLHRDAMCVFGGIADARGACSELWLLDLATESWHLAWSPVTHRGPGPAARYGHSACAHDGAMYIYGGFAGLSHCPAELWRWSFRIGQWSRLRAASAPGKSGGSPPPLAFHAAAVVPGGRMLVFGGEQRDGTSPASLWSYNFSGEVWSIVSAQGPLRPSGTVHHSLLAVPGALADEVDAKLGWRRRRRQQRHRRARLRSGRYRRFQLHQMGESGSTTTTELVLCGSPAEQGLSAAEGQLNVQQQQQQPPSRATTAMSQHSAKDSGYSSCLLDTLEDDHEVEVEAAQLVDGNEEAFNSSLEQQPSLMLEDLEDVPDLFSLSSATLITRRSSTPTPETMSPAASPIKSSRPTDRGGGVGAWAFTNQSMSVSSFGSTGASNDARHHHEAAGENSTDDDDDDLEGEPWSDDDSSASSASSSASVSTRSNEVQAKLTDVATGATVYCLGAPENGINNHCLLVWRGCLTYSA